MNAPFQFRVHRIGSSRQRETLIGALSVRDLYRTTAIATGHIPQEQHPYQPREVPLFTFQHEASPVNSERERERDTRRASVLCTQVQMGRHASG